MRNGKPHSLLLPLPSRHLTSSSSTTTRTPPPPPPPPPPQPPPSPPQPPPSSRAPQWRHYPRHPLSNLLLVASLTKNLLRNIPSPPPPSDTILLSLLRRRQIPPPLKLHLLHVCLPHFTPSPSSFSSLLLSLSSSPSSHPHLLPTLQLFLSLHPSLPLPPSTLRITLSSLLHSHLFDHALLFLQSLLHHHLPTSPTLHTPLLLSLLHHPQHPPPPTSLFLSLLPHSPSPRLLPSNRLLLALRRAGLRRHFLHLFRHLLPLGFPFDSHGFNISIHAFASFGDLRSALSLFRRMKSPDLCTYNSLLSALCSSGRLSDAILVYSDLKSASTPDVFTYTTLIHAFCLAQRIDDALSLFREMLLNPNVRPTTVVYNILLDGLLKSRRLHQACDLFDLMSASGDVRPSSYTYNILIHGLFRNRRSDAAYALFHDLKKGDNLDGVSYSIVVAELCQEGLVDEAIGLVDEMDSRGFQVDLVTVTAVLIALHRRQMWGRAERLLEHVRGQGNNNIIPDVLRWTENMEAMLNSPQDKGRDLTPMFPSSEGGFSRVLSWIGPVEEDEEDLTGTGTDRDGEWSLTPYLDRLAERSIKRDGQKTSFCVGKGKRVRSKNGSSFDVDMMNTYLSIFLRKGKLSVACKLFEIFARLGKEAPVSYTYNSLLSCFVKRQHLKEAWGVLEQMGRDLCPGDIATYNVILQALGKSGNAHLADAVAKRLMSKGGYVDVVMYNTLIHVLGRDGRLEEVSKIFRRMVESGIDPDVVTFNTLVQVYAKAGKVQDAYMYLRKMLDRGCLPNHVTDSIMDFLEKEIDKLRCQPTSSIKPEGE